VDSTCWYEKNDMPDLSEKEGILKALRGVVEGDILRHTRALRRDSVRGNHLPDKDSTTLSSTIARNLEVLTRISIQLGVFETVPTELPSQITGDTVNIINVSKSSTLAEEVREDIETIKALRAELESLGGQR
jgi:hypothetical protein